MIGIYMPRLHFFLFFIGMFIVFSDCQEVRGQVNSDIVGSYQCAGDELVHVVSLDDSRQFSGAEFRNMLAGLEPSLSSISRATGTTLSTSSVLLPLNKAHRDQITSAYGNLVLEQIGLLRNRVSCEKTYISSATEWECSKMQIMKQALLANHRDSSCFLWFTKAILLVSILGALVLWVMSLHSYLKGKPCSEAEIVLSPEQVSVKQASLGVQLLIASMVFYFLYLKFVYPIFVVRGSTS